MAGHAFRHEDRVIDVHFAPAVTAEHAEHAADALGIVFALDQIGRGDRAGVDHGIERAVRSFIQHDGVERFAGRLHADFFEHVFQAVIFQRQAVDERLGNRLDREQLLAIADFEHLAVGGDDRDAEPAGSALASSGM